MYGLTRATVTLIAAGAAGLLIWIGTQITPSTNGKYWADLGLVAAAGLVMALSQLLGGWTKWGVPRLSLGTFLLGFIPVAIAGAWIAVGLQPHGNTFRGHVLAWSGDVGIRDVVTTFKDYLGVVTFAVGLVL